MKKTNITPKNSSRDFKFEELFFSTTDRKGIIKTCNDVFVRVSGYESQDLIGKPHNIIRHPDMPRCVFMLLWEYLLASRPICAYVKNMAKTGEYYWVYALVIPVNNDFLSIRIKPTSKYFDVVQNLYGSLKEKELSTIDWKDGMNLAYKQLIDALSGLGFSSYDEFIAETLRAEIGMRLDLLKKNIDSDRELLYLYDLIMMLINNNNVMVEEKNRLSRFASELELVALNSTVKASLLGRDGMPISVIGQEISRMSAIIKEETSQLSKAGGELLSEINQVSSMLAGALLQDEMSLFFKNKTVNTNDMSLGDTKENLISFLDQGSVKAKEVSKKSINALYQKIKKYDENIDSLSKVFSVLEFSYVTGCTETARISRESEFLPLLDGLRSLSQNATTSLKKLSHSISYFSEKRI